MSDTDPSASPSGYSPPIAGESETVAAVRVDGEEVAVYETPVASFCRNVIEGSATVEIERTEPFEEVVVRPLSRGIEPSEEGRTVRFDLVEPGPLSVEFDDDIRSPVFCFADVPETDVPDPNDPSVRYFEGGRVHDPGVIDLEDGETVYFEPDALVRGLVTARDATDVTVRGRGILDGSGVAEELDGLGGDAGTMLQLFRCENVFLEGITVLNGYDPDGWTVVPVECDGVTMRNLKILGWSANDDGIDVVGSRDVTIDECFVRTKDDCVAIKAKDRHRSVPGAWGDPLDDCGADLPAETCGTRSVRNVRVRGCTFWNAEWGNAVEIGYETSAEEMSGIVFEDCDVIHAEREGYGSGGTFTIHNGDRAHVRDVRYEDIRVEDSQEKLIDFKVQHSRYSVDDVRGHVSDVVLSDVSIVDGRLPPSLIQGFDGEHTVSDVTIRNLSVHGDPVTDYVDAKLITEKARNVRIEYE